MELEDQYDLPEIGLQGREHKGTRLAHGAPPRDSALAEQGHRELLHSVPGLLAAPAGNAALQGPPP